MLINGVLDPEVPTRVGQLERWRLVNASASLYYRLAVDDHEIHVIASDGGRLLAPVPAAEVLLAPGERTELLIAPSAEGRFAVRMLSYDRNGTAFRILLRRENRLLYVEASPGFCRFVARVKKTRLFFATKFLT